MRAPVVAATAALLLLGSCGAQDARMAASAESSCRAIGLEEENAEWNGCLIQMMAAEKARPRARTQTACSMVGGTMMCR